jgi:hypothetical protein
VTGSRIHALGSLSTFPFQLSPVPAALLPLLYGIPLPSRGKRAKMSLFLNASSIYLSPGSSQRVSVQIARGLGLGLLGTTVVLVIIAF